MKNKWMWITLVLVALLGAGYYFRANLLWLIGEQSAGQVQAAQAQGNDSTQANETTVTIRPATDNNQVSAAGNIEIANRQTAVLQVDGVVIELPVKVGDNVKAGDLLLALDTTDLERAVQRAELNLDISQTQLDKLQEPIDPAAIAAAQAALASAQEGLADLKAGASAAELAAAEAALAAAQAKYQELLDGPSEAELTELSVELHKSSITLKNAQEAYDTISYRGDIGSTQQAIDLQNATIDYEAAKAAYEIATEPASPAELQEALKAIKDAESQLETLRNQPGPAELAEAEAKIIGAEADLGTLLSGPSEAELREAELNLQQAQLDLEEAEAALAKARLRAPIDGVILTVDVEVGQKATSGLAVLTMADLTDLELTVNVAEVDIGKVVEGQPAQITIDAIPGRVFSGQVSRIAPASDSESGVVNYAVTIQLDNLDIEGVRPGMTSVATISSGSAEPGWLVPTSALQEFEGETTITIIRNGQPARVAVIPGAAQGEWTVVQSSALKAGDKVIGQVSSFLDEEEGPGGFRGPFGPPPRP